MGASATSDHDDSDIVDGTVLDKAGAPAVWHCAEQQD